MKLVVVEYNAGNVQSVLFALKRLGAQAELTSDSQKILAADKVIFPGVGEASSTMRYLKVKNLEKTICSIKQPILGICLGMQLLCNHSEENNAKCLGVFNCQVSKFKATGNTKLKVPHVGWNNISNLKGKIFSNIPENVQVYFVHSYFAEMNENTSAVCNYSGNFSAAIEKDNFFAVQFHPEKSGEVGEEILRNFINI